MDKHDKPTQQQLRPLRPALQRDGVGLAAEAQTTPLRRRKRNVRTACNSCRARKSGCDSDQPICGPCRRKHLPCIYPAASSSKAPNSALEHDYTTLIEYLRYSPVNVALDIFRRIRGSTDLASVLRHLEGNTLGVFLSGQTAARGVLPPAHSGEELELLTQHPVAYPTLDPSTDASMAEDVRLRRQKTPGPPRLEANPKEPQGTSSTRPTPSHDFGRSGPASPRARFSGSGAALTPTLTISEAAGPEPPPKYCDQRLSRLKIELWTAVPATDQFCAGAISLYLETEHPLLGLFDASLFLGDLLAGCPRYCSPFLVNSLLSFASQIYTQREPAAFAMSFAFQNEAEKLYNSERMPDSVATIAGLMLLFESCGCHGQVQNGVEYIREALQMAKRMKLFGIPNSLNAQELSFLTWEERQATAHAAWGVFNSITLQSMFYVISPPESPPALPIPERLQEVPVGTSQDDAFYSWNPELYQTFTCLCQFWVIACESLLVCHSVGAENISPAFSLSMYQNLLSLADRLPSSMRRSENNLAQVTTFHIFYHCIVLDLFRPFVSSVATANTASWPTSSASPAAIFKASVTQLKRLVLHYRAHHSCKCNGVLWHIGMIYVANALLQNTDDLSWRFYFMLCIGGYQDLFPSFHVVQGITQSLLMMALSKHSISDWEAQLLIQELRERRVDNIIAERTEGFVVDLDLAVSDLGGAAVSSLVERFEEATVFAEFVDGTVADY